MRPGAKDLWVAGLADGARARHSAGDSVLLTRRAGSRANIARPGGMKTLSQPRAGRWKACGPILRPRTGLGKSDRPGSSGGSGNHDDRGTRNPLCLS